MEKQHTSTGVGNRGSDSLPEADRQHQTDAENARKEQGLRPAERTNNSSEQGVPDATNGRGDVPKGGTHRKGAD